MKNKVTLLILIITLLLINVIVVTGESRNSVLIGKIPVGQGEGYIKYDMTGDDNGPISFAISPNYNYYILDAAENEVEVYNKQFKYMTTIKLKEDSYFDIEVKKDNSFIVLSYNANLYKYNADGELISKQHLENITERDIVFSKLIKTKNGNIALRFLHKGYEYIIESDKIVNSFNNIDISREITGNLINENKKMYVTINSDNSDINNLQNKNKNQVALNYDLGLGCTQPLVITKDNNVIIHQMDVGLGKDIYVENRVIKIDNTGKKNYAIVEKTDNIFYPNKFLYADENGNVYNMKCKKDFVEIYKLEFKENKQTNITDEMVQKYSTTAKYNFDPIRHTGAYYRGLDIVEYSWYYDSTTMETPDSSINHTEPPQHLEGASSGWQTGIPYKYGGKVALDTSEFGKSASMLNDFIDELNDGRTAGDINADAVVNTTTGIDCSGFVIASFELPYERSASMIRGGNYEFEDYYWRGSIGGGDDMLGYIGARNNEGNRFPHTFIVESCFYNYQDVFVGILTIESTTEGSDDKAKEYARDANNIDNGNYYPMKLKDNY